VGGCAAPVGTANAWVSGAGGVLFVGGVGVMMVVSVIVDAGPTVML